MGFIQYRHASAGWHRRRPGERPFSKPQTIPAFAGMTILLAFATPTYAAKKLPPCPPKTAQLFIAPMGEPFRAGPVAPDPVTAWFAQLDTNHDGRITLAEFTADADRFFAKLDTDHDGELIPSEVSAYERDIAPEIRLYVPRGAAGMRPPTRKERKRRRIMARRSVPGAGRSSTSRSRSPAPMPISTAP